MKTKLPGKILILFGILGLCFWIAAQTQQTQNQPQNQAPTTNKLQKETPQTREKTFTLPPQKNPEIEDEDDFGYEQDIFSRKLFHEKLPPLNKKQKLVWAFRMAETNSLL
jgi:hypothetical protein